MSDNSLNEALKHFEATEANLVKSEKLLNDIRAAIPDGIVFASDNLQYDDKCRSFHRLWNSLPKLNDWKPSISLLTLDEIAQIRFDAREVDELECYIATENSITEPIQILHEYRYRFNQIRKELVRNSLEELVCTIDKELSILSNIFGNCEDDSPLWDRPITNNSIATLTNNISQIDTLLGSSIKRPARWTDLQRHLHFGLYGDLYDIIERDWPVVKVELQKSLYGEDDPIPVEVEDLAIITKKNPKGPVTTKLHWDRLNEDDFERLIFTLISSESGYENPEWLMKTNAPDHGRDLSVYRVINDSLGGTIRHRVIIQCRHWLSKSISPTDVAVLQQQILMWQPPRVDVIVIATSGRFTCDAVSIIEKINEADNALRIEKWPESHLERLLASRPAIIAEFGLR